MDHRTFSELQRSRVGPLFEYIAQAIEFEAVRAQAATAQQTAHIARSLNDLTEMTAGLPDQYRWAIEKVIRTELQVLLIACKSQAIAIQFVGTTTAA